MPEPEIIQEKPRSLNILELLKTLMPTMPQGGGGGPAGTPAQVGQIGQPFSPTLPGGMRLPSVAGPIGLPTANQPQPSQAMQMPAYQSGFEFSNPKARDAAVVTNAIQGLSQFVTEHKQKQDEKIRAKAENYMSQIIAAQQSGDQQTLGLLLEDPKVLKTLEKGLQYFMPTIPQEPAGPEAKGIHGAINKAKAKLAPPGQPGGVAIPRMPPAQVATQESQRLAAEATLRKLQQDPELAAQQGLGTALSGEEARKAARIAGGLGLSASEYANLDLQDRKSFEAFEMLRRENENKLALEAQRAGTEKDIARIHAGPLYERARLVRDIANAQMQMKKEVARGNNSKAATIAMQSLTSQMNTLNKLAEQAEKDGNHEQSVEYKKEADDAQKQYDEVRKSQQYDIDELLKTLLGPE